MPELPEVEVTLRGISSSLINSKIREVRVHYPKLRENISPEFQTLRNMKVLSLSRRGKYIIIRTDVGSILMHLGMSGHLLVCSQDSPLKKHDHVEIILDNDKVIRFNDQRRFGLFLWIPEGQDVYKNRYLINLGYEPLTDEFTPAALFNALQRHLKKPIKQALMTNEIVVGIGNIYASEILFSCRIHPLTPAGTITISDCEKMVPVIKETLLTSIENGGTTIRDFSGADGKMGYFVQNLNVYGKSGEKCPVCGHAIESIVIGGRNTYFCQKCQKLKKPVN